MTRGDMSYEVALVEHVEGMSCGMECESTIRCYDCGIPIPEPPEDAHVSEMYCDTCYKKWYGDEE